MSDDLELRRATAEDFEPVAAIWRAAFAAPERFATRYAARWRPERVLVAERQGTIVASAASHPTQQWFGGRPVPTAAVAGVGVDPFTRGRGVAGAVVTGLLREERRAGRSFASLFPSTVPVYRRLGFEYGGTYTVRKVPLSALPDPERAGPPVTSFEGDDAGIRASFRRLAAQENAVMEGLADDWWRHRILDPREDGAPGGVVTTGEDEPEGYAAYVQERGDDDWRFTVACSHLVAHSRSAALSLLSFFRRFKSVGQELTWQGPPADPLTMLLPEESDSVSFEQRFMSRILDVPAALQSRGYSRDVRGHATIDVADEAFPENAGRFRVDAEDGSVRVTKVDDAPATAAIGIGALSSMYAGFVTPFAAARAGLIDPGHPALEFLAGLFTGPAPWTPDYF